MLAEQRDESLRKSALREQAAQQVGDLEGDEEGVGQQAGAEHPGDEEIARIAEHPAHHGEAADGQQGAQEVHAKIRPLFRNRTPSWPTSSPPASAPARRSPAARTTRACAPRCAARSRTSKRRSPPAARTPPSRRCANRSG